MINELAQYRKAVKKRLRCCSSDKERILEGFDQILAAYSEEHNSPSMDNLIAAFGPPEEMAGVLMAQVSPQDLNRYHKRARFTRILVVLLAVALAVSTIYIWFFKNVGLSSDNELEIIDQNINSTIDAEQGGHNP